jgi:dihydroorotate dehydrogenase electron transfer subunit
MDRELCTIVEENRMVALDTYLLRLRFAVFPSGFVPGQFVHVQIPGRPDLLLRRPLSVHLYDGQRREMTLIYQIKGEGTKALAGCARGDALSVMGPLGNGFPAVQNGGRAVLVGGGIGCAPLLALPAAYPDTVFDAVLGFRSMAHIYQKTQFEAVCNTVVFTTDDGSYGQKGTVVDALPALLSHPCDVVFACGPVPMLKGLQEQLKHYGVPCHASLEERMGCGMGACMTCTCSIMMEDGGLSRKRVCKDGPVFPLSEVAF